MAERKRAAADLAVRTAMRAAPLGAGAFMALEPNERRAVAEGLTFNNAAEIEAMLRAAAQGDPGRYRALKNQLDTRYASWSDKNPGRHLTGELAGALLPGLVALLTPGGQGAAAGYGARVVQGARAMAEPVTMAAERFVPRLAARMSQSPSRLARMALPVADELLTGAVQSAGLAEDWRDIPATIADQLPQNLLFSLGVRGGNEAAKAFQVRRKGSKK